MSRMRLINELGGCFIKNLIGRSLQAKLHRSSQFKFSTKVRARCNTVEIIIQLKVKLDEF